MITTSFLKSRNAAILSVLLAGVPSSVAFAAEPVFTGSMLHVIEETPERSTGLDKIFIIYDTSGVQMEYPAADVSKVKIYKFSNLGGAFAEEVAGVIKESSKVILPAIEGDCGYIIEDADKRYYYWIVNYLPYRFQVRSIAPSDMSDCDASILDVDGFAPAIHYFTINGQQKVLSRDINVSYLTQEWSESKNDFVQVDASETLEYFDATIRISPPALCHTPFHIKGDRFLEEWNWATEAESIVIAPTAVRVHTTAIQDDEDVGTGGGASGGDQQSKRSQRSGFGGRKHAAETGDNGSDDGDSSVDTENGGGGSNQITGDDTGLGGSAPADIEFVAYVTEGVMHFEWQMAKDSEFEEIDYRFNVQNLDYTFLEEGTYYLRFIGSNSDGSCEAVGDTYTVSIGTSELLCPNAFSPDDDGVNDIWKISYRSLLEFDCWIFDRYGAELYHFSDPEGGWDGKRGGKTVKPGVYFYVITATGADGKKYKKSGDINILRRTVNSQSLGTSEE